MKRSVVLVQLLVTAVCAAVGGFVAVSVSSDAVDADRGGMTAAVPMMTEAQLRVGGATAASDLATTTITPVRILDTRVGAAALAGSKTPWGALETRTVEAAGLGTIPTDAVGVVVNVTVLNATASDTFLTLFPTGTAMPNASTINPQPGEVAFNAATVLLGGDDGTFEIYNYSGTVDVIVDVTAYMTRTLADAVDTVETDVDTVEEEVEDVADAVDAVETGIEDVADDVGRLGHGVVYSSPTFAETVFFRSDWTPIAGSVSHSAARYGIYLSPDQVSDDTRIGVTVLLRSSANLLGRVPQGNLGGVVCYRLSTMEGGPIFETEVCTDDEDRAELIDSNGSAAPSAYYRLEGPTAPLNGLSVYLEWAHFPDEGVASYNHPGATERYLVRVVG